MPPRPRRWENWASAISRRASAIASPAAVAAVETWKKRTFTNVRAERLNRPIYVNGKRVYENPPLRDIRDFCAAQVATLWDEVTRFENPHRYYVDLSQKLWDERQRLLTEFGR